MSPSPESNKTPDLLREIFRTAAENSTGAGKPKFERLSKAFNEVMDCAEAKSSMKYEIAMSEFNAAMADVQVLAKVDPATEKTLFQLYDSISKEQRGEYVPTAKKSTSRRWHI